MKEQAVLRQAALEYLERDRPLHMDMLEPIRRGQAEILKAGPGGVLIYETRSRTHMLSAESLEAGKALCCRVEHMTGRTQNTSGENMASRPRRNAGRQPIWGM